MKTTLTRLFTVMLLIMVSMGAMADVKVLFGEKGESTFKSDGGTIEVKQETSKEDATKVTVYLIVTPNKGYTMQEKDVIEAYATAPANIGKTRAPEISEKITFDCKDFKDEYSTRTYSTTISSSLALWVKSATFEQKNREGAKNITLTYHIINLGRLGDNGQLTTTRTEALQFTASGGTVAVPGKYKSPLAKGWKYYSASDVTFDSSTKVCTFNSATPSLSEGATLTENADIYVTYELDEEAFETLNLINGCICYIKFNNEQYLCQSTYNNEPNTAPESTTTPTAAKFLWKFNIVDPYQVTIQSKSNSYTDSFLSSTNEGNFGDIRLKASLSDAKSCKVWAFGLLNGSAENTYRLVVTDGFIKDKNTNGIDEFGHGYLNNHDKKGNDYKTRYQKYEGAKYSQCDLVFEPLTRTYMIVDNTGNTLVKATNKRNRLGIPDFIKSPFASYTYYGTLQDAKAGDGEKTLDNSTFNGVTTIYVRYSTSGGDLDLNGGTNYYTLTNGSYLIASDNTTLGITNTVTSTTDNTYKWKITGNDAYQLTIQNADNSQFIAYNVSSGEAAPTLSSSGSKFFLHQSTSGKYELVAVTSNDFSTTDYYTLGVAGSTLKLYSKTNYPFGESALQTVFSTQPPCADPEITYDNTTGKVSISSATEGGATIYYTTDGTEPDLANVDGENPTKTYGAPFDITSTTTIKAVAVKDGRGNSIVAEKTIEQLDAPSVTFDVTTQSATITTNSTVEGVTTVYTDTGTEPTTGSDPYTAALPLTATTTIKAMTIKEGYINSSITEKTISKLDAPTIISAGQTVTITGGEGETIYYTTNGTEPDPANVGGENPTQQYTASFNLGENKYTIKAIATKAESINSSVATQVVDLRSAVTVPTITYFGSTIIITATSGDEIYYSYTTSTDSNAPDDPLDPDGSLHGTTTVTINLDSSVKTCKVKAYSKYSSRVSSIVSETIDLTEKNLSGICYLQSNKNNSYYMCPSASVKEEGKPLVQTKQEAKMAEVWQLVRIGKKTYRIIHYNDGKYMVATTTKDEITNSVWLEATDSPGDNTKFLITETSEGSSIYNIKPIGANNTDSKDYLNVSSGNGSNHTIGLYTAGDDYSKWLLKKVPAAPTFTVSDITVTMNNVFGEGDIYYTTDNSTPTKLSTQGTGVTFKYGPKYKVKAICVYHDDKSGDDWTSEIATKEIQVGVLNPILSQSGNTVIMTSSQNAGVTYRYTFNDNGSDPVDPVAPNGAGTDYISAEPPTLTAGARNVFKAIAYNTVDGTTYKSGVVTFIVDLRGSTLISSLAEITNSIGNYKFATGFSASGTPKEGGTGAEIGTGANPFRGTIDGNLVEFELNSPLFDYVKDATIKNVIVSKATISTSGNAGAIANNAKGATRIYNCGVLATGSTVGSDKDGYTKITDCSSTISGGSSGYVGGIVGLLDGSSRVINCFSYANITGGNKVGGIVGYNNVKTTSTNLATMVMNCMFYGDITGGTNKAPIYNGSIITNRGDASGVSNFNYFWGGASYVTYRDADNNPDIQTYNCALLAETRFLQRFEFFRHVLNGHRELAAWWATGSTDNKDLMMKWVLEPLQIGTDHPYPILKTPKDDNGDYIQYPSVVNIDAAHAKAFDDTDKKLPRNKGRKFGTLTINIQEGSGGPTTGASITTTRVTPNITDKDPDHFNFNYYKVQLPYYNDVGSGNYTQNKVVTGWKIVSVNGSGYGTNTFSTGTMPADATATVDNTTDEITLTTPYNYADRKCTQKDVYETNDHRIFNQGAYFDVPEGVTSITIEPYWAKCVYVADAYPDVVYNKDMNTSYNVTTVGGGQKWTNDNSYSIAGDNQKVYTSMSTAVSKLNPSGTVYDNAIVLVGNVHNIGITSDDINKPYTIMSIDLDKDNEPDYSYILRFDSRIKVHPVRIDFLNVIGLGMAQKSYQGTGTYNLGIMQPKNWFECTNTGLFRVTQLEYDQAGRTESPMILHGGVIEQWVAVGQTEQTAKEAKAVSYYHVGGNVWFKEFHIGAHQDKTQNEFWSPHPPISVSGGDYDIFYLTGYYNTPGENAEDNAECYINGGRFSKVAGTGMQGIGKTGGANNTGNIIWQIDNADIDEFYAGGINAAHKAEGNIYTVITNSRVDQFCGGPKFGDMNNDKIVVTNAENCTFRTFFGAGYGGNSYNRRYPANQNNVTNINWNSWLTGTASYDYSYDSKYGGVETRIDYQFIPMSGNTSNVARLFIDHVSFSLATTHNVTTKLTGCTITKSHLGRLDISDNDKRLGNFYGGGSLGKVAGPLKSSLINCTVEGNVFGAGYSASKPTVSVMGQAFQTEPRYNQNLGVYLDAVPPTTTEYKWEHKDEVNSTETAIKTTETDHILYTQENLTKSNLGSVEGNVNLTIKGDSEIGTNGDTSTGHVYGGGDDSYVIGSGNKITVTLQGNAHVRGNVYGGGNKGFVEGRTEVNIKP